MSHSLAHSTCNDVYTLLVNSLQIFNNRHNIYDSVTVLLENSIGKETVFIWQYFSSVCL